MCSDPKRKFYPQREVCYATMHREAANAAWQRLHHERQWHDGSWSEWVAKPDGAHPVHRDFGVNIGVTLTDVRPDDQFLALEECGPPSGPLPEPDDGVQRGG